MKEATFITPEGWQKLNKDMEALWDERKQVTEAVSEAAAMGDRSENAEYIYGKKRLRELDRKIGFLHKRFKILTVYNPEVRNTSIVAFGAYVKFKDETGRSMQFRLVGVDEANIKQQTLSVVSPIGKALLNRKLGESVEVQTPAGLKTFTIESINY
ncbi:GreA/GreB family elongation factor [Limibacter armeniacum]|uniref:GreA/GreB family elongation factor n=1 Tax=Limibacter armeniacum TaxID=466084 RepID=UPI002FE64FBC